MIFIIKATTALQKFNIILVLKINYCSDKFMKKEILKEELLVIIYKREMVKFKI